jgi:hypothetical protein
MKNQYFGDVNDYRKYGVLRMLAREGASRIVVCWMLTPSDGGGDGRFTKYLDHPERWREFDPPLFDALRHAVGERGERAVAAFERTDLLPVARFWSEILHDDTTAREDWFTRFWDHAGNADLVFFDPDNGLEVGSVPRGRRNSSKYIYWAEVEEAARRGHSILIYQHFRREGRGPFVNSMAAELGRRCGMRDVITLRTAHVVFLLAPQPKHYDVLSEAADGISQRWGAQITVLRHAARG